MNGNEPRKCGRRPLQVVAMAIKQRTSNPNHKSYKNYGARGISMCPEWANDYAQFERYCLENGWKPGLQVDRINNDGNYEPGNIRFVAGQENRRNTRVNKLNPEKVKEIHIMRAKGMTMKAISEVLKVSEPVVHNVLTGKLWSDIKPDPDSLKGFAPINTMAQKLDVPTVRAILKAHYIDGVPKKQLARQYGTPPNTIRYILRGRFWNSVWREFNYLMMFLKPSPKADYATT